jgi:hypothetical protein
MQMFLRVLKRVLLSGGMLMLAACATIPPPDYPRDHPANPNAEAAAVEPPSTTLISYRPETAKSKGDAGSSSDSASEHGGNGTQDHSQSTPQDEGHGDH